MFPEFKVDPDVERMLKFAMSHIPQGEWIRRREAIENKIARFHADPRTFRDADDARLTVIDDRIAWYLYLVDAACYTPENYEPTEGCRVLPVFKRLGSELEILRSVPGLEDRMERMLVKNVSQPDAALFELLVALTWRRNGWKDVAFLPENAQGKQPDIRAARGEETWLIEAKRLDKTSQYSELERQKWLMMWARFSDALGHSRLSLLFDIVFHVELADLPANFLQEHLTRHIRAVDAQAVLVSDTVWTVSVRPVDINAARAHLEKFYVKYPSEQLNMLITGPRNLSRGFTYVISPKLVYAGERALTNVFVDEIDFASGALWSCDAARAIEKKARDVRGHIARAVEQIPLGQRAAIHIGLETLDGAEVERERLSRIINTVRQFDLMGRNVRWIYCHLFQSYAPPQGAWTIDETTFFFTHNRFEKPPLQSMTLIVPEAEMLNSGVHWERPPPY